MSHELVTLHGGCFVGGSADWDAAQTSCLRALGIQVHQLDFPKDECNETLDYIENFILERAANTDRKVRTTLTERLVSWADLRAATWPKLFLTSTLIYFTRPSTWRQFSVPTPVQSTQAYQSPQAYLQISAKNKIIFSEIFTACLIH